MILIKNHALEVEINPLGGCISKITDLSDGERLTFAGAPFWNYADHIQFPLVCRMADKYYEVDGKRYDSDIHGFAKDSLFTEISVTDDCALLELNSSEKTKSLYPYDFSLRVKYVLDGNKLSVAYTVKNTDTKKIYFAIGAHPSFTLDSQDGDTAGNYLHLKDGEFYYYSVDEAVSLINRREPLGNLSKIELSKSFFKKYDTLIVERLSNEIKIQRKCGKSVIIDCNSPIISIWANPNEGNYVCVESFWGLPDYASAPDRELSKKSYVNKLEEGEQSTFKYEITFNAR